MFDIKIFSKEDINEILPELKDNIEFKNEKGMNLLHLALINHNINTPVIVKFLLENGIDPNELDSKLKSAFDYAKICNNMFVNRLLNDFNHQDVIDDDY